MCTSREPFAYKGDNAGVHAGQAGRQFNIVDAVKHAAKIFGFVLPGDAEEVELPKTEELTTNLGSLFKNIKL